MAATGSAEDVARLAIQAMNLNLDPTTPSGDRKAAMSWLQSFQSGQGESFVQVISLLLMDQEAPEGIQLMSLSLLNELAATGSVEELARLAVTAMASIAESEEQSGQRGAILRWWRSCRYHLSM